MYIINMRRSVGGGGTLVHCRALRLVRSVFILHSFVFLPETKTEILSAVCSQMYQITCSWFSQSFPKLWGPTVFWLEDCVQDLRFSV